MARSLIPPSLAGTWAPEHGCHGCVTLLQQFPKPQPSEDLLRGLAAHELAAKMIRAGARASVGTPARENTLGTQAPNGIVFDEEIFAGVEIYAGYAIGLMRDRGIFGGPGLGVEMKVKATSIHPRSYGVLDYYMFDRIANEVIVADYKNGRSVVEVFRNWQLVNYVVGALDTRGLKDPPNDLKIRLVIIQPNAYHKDGPIREWRTTIGDLHSMFNQLKKGASRAHSANPETRSGPHCRYCSARHACDAAIAAGPCLYEMVSDTNPIHMTVPDMAAQFTFVNRAMTHLKSMQTAFQEQLKAAARSGQDIPGYRTEPSKGREVWAKTYEEIVRFGVVMGKDLRKQETLTPNQARELGIDDALIGTYSKRNRVGIKLVPEDLSLVRKDFGYE